MKKVGKLYIKEIILVAACAVVAVMLLAATYFIPQRYMYDHIKESAIILHNEGLGKFLWETIRATELDTYTDGLMLNIAYTVTGDGARDVLLGPRVKVGDINPMESLYEVVALGNGNYWVKNYARYWHGHLVLLRPLLCFFTYAEIRQINMAVQLVLVFVLITMLANSEHRRLIVPFCGMYIFLTPISLFSSLQYSPCFYIMMLTLLALFALGGYLNDVRRNYVFVLSGIMTAFFDLLTYPLVTLAVPLAAHLASDRECAVSVKKSFKDTVLYTISWGVGYAGMWASKWIIASMLTDENVIKSAIDQIKHRSGHFNEDFTWLSTIRLNLGACGTKVIFIALLGLLLYMVIKGVINRCRTGLKWKPLSCTGAVLFVAAYPFLWYFCTLNHSSAHYYFTWRELAASVFAVAAAMAVNAGGNALKITV